MSDAANLFPGVKVVLVETSHPGNIGAAARAMKNMGLTELVLVNPYSFPDDKAIFRSASAEDVVRSAIVVDSEETAIADCELVIGTSARDRRIPWPMLSPKQCGEKVAAAAAAAALLGGGGDSATAQSLSSSDRIAEMTEELWGLRMFRSIDPATRGGVDSSAQFEGMAESSLEGSASLTTMESASNHNM